MPAFVDLEGQTFGRITVVRFARVRDRRTFWHCRCACGTKKEIAGNSLTTASRPTRSCGCLKQELHTTHGMRGPIRTPEYVCWCNIKDRCTNPNFIGFKNYGGRGIKVCRRWMKFENFLADMGRRPSFKHSIDRIDNNGDYTKKNCRWATRPEQRRNRRLP